MMKGQPSIEIHEKDTVRITTSIKRLPDGDEVRGKRLKWRNKTTVMHCERGGRKFFRKERESKQGRQRGDFNFSWENMNSIRILSGEQVVIT